MLQCEDEVRTEMEMYLLGTKQENTAQSQGSIRYGMYRK